MNLNGSAGLANFRYKLQSLQLVGCCSTSDRIRPLLPFTYFSCFWFQSLFSDEFRGQMVEAFGCGLIDHEFESWPGHIFHFFFLIRNKNVKGMRGRILSEVEQQPTNFGDFTRRRNQGCPTRSPNFQTFRCPCLLKEVQTGKNSSYACTPVLRKLAEGCMLEQMYLHHRRGALCVNLRCYSAAPMQ